LDMPGEKANLNLLDNSNYSRSTIYFWSFT